MTQNQPEARNRLFFWGPVVLASCILALSNLPYHLMREYHEWESARHPGLPDTAIALSIGVPATSLMAMQLAGMLTDWTGARRTILTGLSLGGAGLALISLSQSAWGLYPAYLLTNAGVVIGGWLPVMVGICRRFHRRRTMAIALVNTAHELLKQFPAGASIFLLIWVSWSSLTASLGLAFLLAALAGHTVLTVRSQDATRQSGAQDPDGGTTGELPTAPARADFSSPQALRTRAFWLIVTGNAVAAMSTTSTAFFLVSMMSDRGHSITSAGTLLATFSMVSLLSTLVAGSVGTRYSLRRGLAAFIGVQAAGLAVLSSSDDLALAFIAVGTLAFGAGARITLSVAILAGYFGTSSLGKILGWSQMPVILAIAAGLPLFGLALDQGMNYTSILLMLAGLSLLSALCFLKAREPSHPGTQVGAGGGAPVTPQFGQRR